MFLTEEKIGKRIEQLVGLRYRRAASSPIAEFSFVRDDDAKVASPAPEGHWNQIAVGESWIPEGATHWLQTDVEIPTLPTGQRVVGLFRLARTGRGFSSGVEAMLHLDGRPYQGIDPNHDEVFFGPEHLGRRVELLFKVWGAIYGHESDDTVPVEFRITRAEITALDEATDDLYFTALAAYGTVRTLPKDSWERRQLLSALDRAFLVLDWRVPGDDAFYRSTAEANGILGEQIAAIPKNNSVSVRCIGHSHIDVAWLWRLSDTREKAARTFSTALRLMEQFPEYVFLQTQPQLYDYLETDYPSIFEEIVGKVHDGQWEAAGAMWLESDCNVPSGESLVRQMLYGIRYFERKHGTRCEYLWLPDVFGYSWALPQILKKSGVKYFMTTKISWNVYNRFPHDTFIWRGIDGSEVVTHFITTPEPGNRDDNAFTRFYTYNGQVLPETVTGIWENYQDKEINDDLLLSFGWGDGGGGPTRQMLELRRRLERMPGVPTVTTGRADDYFRELGDRIANTDRYVHRWDGELYLELHRGTYTSQAYNKRANRAMENRLRTAEMICAFADAASGRSAYPAKEIYESWKIVLRNQFHDILPGSSIGEVYEDCRREYTHAEALADSATRDALSALTSMVPAAPHHDRWAVFNALSWERSECVELPWRPQFNGATWTQGEGVAMDAERVSRPDGDVALVWVDRIPAHGYTTVSCDPARRAPASGDGGEGASPDEARPGAGSPFTVRDQGIATPFYEIEWNEHGSLTRVYDRLRERDIIPKCEVANRFDVHEDKPVAHETWEIDIFYYEKVRHVDELISVTIVEVGMHRAAVRFTRRYDRSTIVQDMVVYADHGRVDFVTRVDWQERQQLLKVAFPVDVRATEATYEIQFGTVKRPTHWNTSWDYARFETVAQRWIDLSERGFGVSLMNDCKYGHDVRDNVMRITLIKSGINPDPRADLGQHEFTYSFYAHGGDWFEAGTVELAHRLNAPVVVAEIPATTDTGTSAEESAGPEQSPDAGLASAGHAAPAPAQPVQGPGAARRTIAPRAGFLSCDSDHVVVDTVKRAEDSDNWIVRCYEFAGKRGRATLGTHFAISTVAEVDLLERETGVVESDGRSFTAAFGPYEIKTFRVSLQETNGTAGGRR